MRALLRSPAPISLAAALVVTIWAGPAQAQDQRRGFVEASGGWGVQFGETDYLPNGAPGAYQHPVVTGFAGGASAGFFVADDLALFGSYGYASAKSRTGDLPMVLEEVQGSISFHTITAGLRVLRPAGPGRIRLEFAVGVVLPYETELELQYGPALAALPEPITGTGVQTMDFAMGYGGHGAAGYELDVAGPVYVAAGLRLEGFQSNNKDEETRLDNFVTDFEAEPPTAVTTVIEHGDGGASPQTNAVVDLRALLSVGVTF